MSYASSSSSTFPLFAVTLAAGVASTLPVVPLARTGRGFFVLTSLVSFVCVGLAVVSQGLDLGLLYLVFAGFLLLYNLVLPPDVDEHGERRVRRPGARPRVARESSRDSPPRLALVSARVALCLAIASGLAALVADAVSYPEALSIAGFQPLWLSAVFVSSALLLGSALVAMVLGHWYLVVPRLSFAPLRRLNLLLSAALCLRCLVAIVTFWLQRDLWTEVYSTHSGATGFFLSHGIFLVPRVLFGLVVPLVLVRMAWNCVKIRSNQSATGILYVVVAFVFIGEILATHFLVARQLVV